MSLADGILLRWCLLSEPGVRGDTAPGCGSADRHRVCASPSAAQWEMGPKHRPVGEKPCGDLVMGSDPQVVTCSR